MAKNLIAYFSYSGTTEKMARMIAEATDGDLLEIKRQRPYPKTYDECVGEAKTEKAAEARPALVSYDMSEERFNNYEAVFIGYPIWWYDAPMPIYSFLESRDFKGKTIIPFATSGGSGFSGSEEKIARITGASVKAGLLFRGNVSKDKIDEWLKRLGL